VKIRQALAVIAILASFGGWRLAAQARTGAKRFTLSGTVVDGATSQPLAGVEVSLQTEKWSAVGEPAVSDGQGRFAFTGLAPGEYILSAEGSFGTIHYGDAPDPGWVSTVRVGGEGGDKSVVFRIVPRGAIEGVVRDEFGDPMMHAQVSVSRPVWRDGRSIMANAGQKSTDDRGRYRFGSLAPGNYIVCAGGGQNAPAPMPGPADYAARVDNRFYSRTCNRAFQLSPGQHAQVDLSPVPASTATVRGHVRNLPPQMGFSVLLSSDTGNEGFTEGFGAFVDATQGTFIIRGVPPGRYRLRAQVFMNAPGGAQKALTANLPLDVAASDIDGLDVALDSAVTVDVAFHGDAENPIGPRDVSVNLYRDVVGDVQGYAREKDGEFHFEAVPPGSYRLSALANGENCVTSVKLGDREVRGAAFDLAPGAALHFDVAMSRNCGSVRMRAVRDGAAVPGAKMVLLLTGTAKDPGDLKQDFANDEGELSFSGLPPGRYLVWAWAVTGKGAMAGPASLAAVEQQATVVEVTAGDPVHVDVPLLATEGTGQ
jgi:protocatechuate 3,4-dioxygenase beta subunit